MAAKIKTLVPGFGKAIDFRFNYDDWGAIYNEDLVVV